MTADATVSAAEKVNTCMPFLHDHAFIVGKENEMTSDTLLYSIY